KDLFQSTPGAGGLVTSLADLDNPLFHGDNRSLGFTLDGLDHLADLTGRTGGPFGQGTHLIGDNRKTAPLLTGTGSLNSGIQRQKVGLVGNIFNRADDLTNLVGTGTQAFDGLGGVPDPLGNGVHYT